jgi:hypothetical protein
MQATTKTAAFASDLPTHISFATVLFTTRLSSYPLFHLLILLLDKLPFINLFTGSALVLAVSSIGTALIIRWGFIKLWNKNQSCYLIDVLSICLIMYFNVYLQPYNQYIYYPIGGSNVWHNPTYIVLKPLAVLSFFIFVLMYEKFRKKEKYVIDLILFAVVLFLSALAKPSFISIFLPALAIFLIVELIASKFKTFKFSCLIVLSLLPVIALLGYQFLANFTGTTGGGSGIVFKLGGEWSNTLKNTIIPIILVNAFSLYVFIFGGFKETFHDKKYLLGTLTMFAGCLEFYLLAMTGSMAGSGNFAWGYYIGAVIFMVISAYKFVFEMKLRPVIRNIGLGILTIQLITGVYYFTTLLMGKFYF